MIAPSDNASAPAFPARVGRYALLLPLGVGGTACVYLARDTGVGGFERDVALKLMHPHLRDRERVVELFEEAKLTARIRHHHVVPVLDVGEAPEGVFLVTEYVEGGPLSDLARAAEETNEPLPPSIALRLVCDALSGLHAAHELTGEDGQPLHLVHRDFSPQNILVGVDGVARLTDFGIAKARSREGFTTEGLIKGKLGYLSPEQARGAPVDRRSDVWAAAVVAWEALAGRRMFPKGDEMATLLRIVEGPAPRLRSAWPEAPAELDEVLAVALQKEARARWPTALEFRARLLAGFGPVADTPEVAQFARDAFRTRLAKRHEELERTVRVAARTLEREPVAASAATTSAIAPLSLPAQPGEPRHRNARVRTLRVSVATSVLLGCVVGATLLARGKTAPVSRDSGGAPAGPLPLAASTSLATSASPALPSEPAAAAPTGPAAEAPKSHAPARDSRGPGRLHHGSGPAPSGSRLPPPLGNPYSSAP